MTVAIIGAGVMGETLLSGLLRSGTPAADVAVGEKRADRAAELRSGYGVAVVSNVEAAAAETVLLVVKPQDMTGVLDEIAPVLRPGQLLVSLAAGITTALVERHVPDGVAVVRVMPNTPALVDAGMAAISGGAHATEAHLARTEALLAATGKVLRVPEDQQDAVTAISGSGPAYVFLVVEAMVDGGVALGLPREVAAELTLQTLTGAAKLLTETGEEPAALRAKVTSPNGTTAAAVAQLQTHGLIEAFAAATRAARDRSVELAAGTD
ncbi:MAG: pyrroline-5-carboxylate reductase [Propionibacteriales bacterium]|nr:pyrroline-5-carboxylate reductase [Propionibacteriales bacterium]